MEVAFGLAEYRSLVEDDEFQLARIAEPSSTVIAIDIDDTLYSFRDAAIEALSEQLANSESPMERDLVAQAIYTPWTQWRTPHDMLGDMWMETINIVHDHEMILSQRPYQHAVEVLNKLSEAGQDLIYISNRATETYEATYQWLENNGFPTEVSRHHLVCTDQNKAPFIRNCQYLIDDRTKTIVEFLYDLEWRNSQAVDRVAFGLMKQYNENLTDVPNVYLSPTWTGLDYYFQKKGLYGN